MKAPPETAGQSKNKCNVHVIAKCSNQFVHCRKVALMHYCEVCSALQPNLQRLRQDTNISDTKA